MTTTLLATSGALAAALTALWFFSLLRRDASIVDPFWGAGFVLVAGLAAWRHWPVTTRGAILLGMTAVWGQIGRAHV